MRLISLIILVLLQTAFSCKREKPVQKPNIILIYADDLGRGLLGIYGQKIITTPNIDKLATNGMRFDNVYGCMYCAPACASLITGMHDCHKNEWNITQAGIYKKLDREFSFDEIKDKIHKVAIPAKENDIFLAQVLQNAGYTTAEFGKLEWGFATTPERIARHGWDYHFGYYDHVRCHGFYPPFLFENGEKIQIPGNTRVDCGKTGEPETPEKYKERWNMEGKAVYSENIIMEKLLGFIDEHNPQKTGIPFFIHFPTQLPHGPVAIPKVHPDFVNNSSLTEIEKEYASMVKMLDDDVERIQAKLEDMGIADNTIIIFAADNGHEIYYAADGRCSKNTNKSLGGDPYDNINTKFYSELNGDIFNGNDSLAGIKRSNWEGGVRVPLIWYWKGKIKPGAVSNQMISNYDLLNTFAEITGQKEIRGKDGVSYAKTLLGGKSNTRDFTVYSSFMGPALVTKEGWKLRYYMQKNVFQLYYLPNDYREENELAAQYPEKADSLKNILLEACDGNWENGIFNGKKLVQP